MGRGCGSKAKCFDGFEWFLVVIVYGQSESKHVKWPNW